jgi:hypothetical protein
MAAQDFDSLDNIEDEWSHRKMLFRKGLPLDPNPVELIVVVLLTRCSAALTSAVPWELITVD